MKLLEYLSMLDQIELSPVYQRGEVWTRAHRSAFLGHIVEFRKVPTIILRKLDDGRFEMVDGKQRTECLRAFYKGEIALPPKTMIDFIDGSSKTYSELEAAIREAIDAIEVGVDIRTGVTDEQAVALFVDLQGGTRLTSAEVIFSAPSMARDAAYELAALPFFERVTFRSARRDIQDLCLKLLYAEHVKDDRMPKDGTASNLVEFCRKFEKTPLPESEVSRVRDTMMSMNKDSYDIASLNKTDVVNLYLAVQACGDKLNGWFQDNRERLRKELVALRISAVHAKFNERRGYILKEVEAAGLVQKNGLC